MCGTVVQRPALAGTSTRYLQEFPEEYREILENHRDFRRGNWILPPGDDHPAEARPQECGSARGAFPPPHTYIHLRRTADHSAAQLHAGQPEVERRRTCGQFDRTAASKEARRRTRGRAGELQYRMCARMERSVPQPTGA
eukprot:gene10260-biopygen1748